MRDVWLQHFPEHVRELGFMLASAKKTTILLIQATRDESKDQSAILSMPSAEMQPMSPANYEKFIIPDTDSRKATFTYFHQPPWQRTFDLDS